MKKPWKIPRDISNFAKVVQNFDKSGHADGHWYPKCLY